MMNDEQQPPAGWYPQPDGSQRYWDGDTWLGVIPPPPPAVGQPAAVMVFLTPEQQRAEAERLKASAWNWAALALLFTPLGLIAVWKNVDARTMGQRCGVEVGWGPTIMACILLAFSVLWVLFWLSGAFG